MDASPQQSFRLRDNHFVTNILVGIFQSDSWSQMHGPQTMGGDCSQASKAPSLWVHVSSPLDTAAWGEVSPSLSACHLFPVTVHPFTPSFLLSLLILQSAYKPYFRHWEDSPGQAQHAPTFSEFTGSLQERDRQMIHNDQHQWKIISGSQMSTKG